jgi:hypothetical protein
MNGHIVCESEFHATMQADREMPDRELYREIQIRVFEYQMVYRPEAGAGQSKTGGGNRMKSSHIAH